MPFSLKNVGAMYQSIVSQMFKDQLRFIVEAYIKWYGGEECTQVESPCPPHRDVSRSEEAWGKTQRQQMGIWSRFRKVCGPPGYNSLSRQDATFEQAVQGHSIGC